MGRRYLKRVAAYAFSIAAMMLLFRSISWQDIVAVMRGPIKLAVLSQCLGSIVIILALYTYRWYLLLDGKLRAKEALSAVVLGLGGNMFLPVRCGDLLRIQYSHARSKIPHASVFSRLLIERLIELATMVAIGAAALGLIDKVPVMAVVAGIVMAAGLFALVAFLKYANAFVVIGLRPLFRLVRCAAFFERHVVTLFHDLRTNLSKRAVLLPGLLTLAMWLLGYAGCYLFAARFVGVPLSYVEALIVLVAGALGAMLPAAPSGIGTFHASVVSAFLLLDRPAAEGLLVGTVIHLLFFLAYAPPAAILLNTTWRASTRQQ